MRAAAAGPVADLHMEAPLPSKFGELSIAAFDITGEAVRHCLGFLRQFDDPPLQIAGRFCQGGADYIERSTLDCALDRLTLLAAGSEPKIGALFAQAELNRQLLRRARSDPCRHAQIQAALEGARQSARAAPHRPLAVFTLRSRRTFTLQRGVEFSLPPRQTRLTNERIQRIIFK